MRPETVKTRKVYRKVRDEMTSVVAILGCLPAPIPVGRFRRVTPAKMAKMVDHRNKDSIGSIATEIVERYQLNATQHKEITNRVIATRAMRCRIWHHIRHLLPVRQTSETSRRSWTPWRSSSRRYCPPTLRKIL